ncbi:hypothetical protein PFISCL1PPCAC_1211, partial [Pristionchus fissidentatus]
SLRELHYLGFVLRDLSLQNFCIGSGSLGTDHIFINQAFSIRPFIEYDGVLLRSNKSRVRPFSPYSSCRARLRDEDIFPLQDVESWLWMMMCLHDVSWIPIENETGRAAKERKALTIKEALWEGLVTFPKVPNSHMPKCYRGILRYLRSLSVEDRVGYEDIRTNLDRCMPSDYKHLPLDWQTEAKTPLIDEDYIIAKCPKNKIDPDSDRTPTIRRDTNVLNPEKGMYTSRVVTTLQRNEATLESRSKDTTISRRTEVDDEKHLQANGQVPKIPEAAH